MSPAPFFIVGSGRCGSTLLRVILASHSRLAVSPETWFVRLLIRKFGVDRTLDAKDLETAIGIVTGHYRWPDMNYETDAFVRDVSALERPHLRHFLELIYRNYLEKEGKHRWGDKTPGYYEIIAELAALFPGAKFIHLIRDGRDVVKSFQATGWYGPWLHDNAREWVDALEHDERWNQQALADSMLRIRYEDLVLDTEASVRRICAFLGEDFEPQMLSWTEQAERLIPQREMAIHEKVKRQPESTDTGRWRHEMSAREIFVCEAFMGRHLSRMGYERRFPNRAWAPLFWATRQYCRGVLPVLGYPVKALWQSGRWPARQSRNGRLLGNCWESRIALMRQVLFLTMAFPPDNLASAERPGQLHTYLPEHGYQPIVVASSTHGAQDGPHHVHRVPAQHAPGAARIASTLGRWFTRYCAPYQDRLEWTPYAVAKGSDLLKGGSVAAVYSTSPSLAAQFAALRLKRRFGLPWIADFQDPIRDNPFRMRQWIYPYDAIIEKAFFRHADRLIANTDTVAEAWRARYPQWAEKISILWNSFDPREDVIQVTPPSRPHRVLAHVGNLYGERHPTLLLQSLERLGTSPARLQVKLIGPIASDILERTGPLLERGRAKGLLAYGNRLVPREEALRETTDADYLLLLDLNETNASFQMPSKLLNYIRSGKPILAYTPKDSPVERILAASGIAHVAIDPRTPEALADAKVAEFLSLPPEPRTPSSWFEDTFNARTQARQIAALLDALLQNRPCAPQGVCA